MKIHNHTTSKEIMNTKNIYLKFTYYIFLILILLQTFLDGTQISYIALRQPLRWLTFLAGCFVVIKIAVEWKSWKTSEMVTGLLGAGLLLLCGLYQNNVSAASYALLILGAKGMDSKKILRCFLVMTGLLTLLTIFLCLGGVIEDIITYRYEDSTHMRHSLGFSYATCLTSHILIIVFVYAYLRNEKLTWLELLLFLGLGVFCYWIAEARIATASILALGFVFMLQKVKKAYGWLTLCMDKSWIRILLTGSGVIFTLLGIILGLCYNPANSAWQKLASFSSGRIPMNATAFERYQVGWLGQSISSVGEQINGQHSVSANYFTLNTSYIAVLFQLGMLGLLAVLFMWCFIARKEYIRKHYAIVLMFAIFGIFCFFEHRLMEFSNNPFFILLLSEPFYMNGDTIPNRKHSSENHFVWSRAGEKNVSRVISCRLLLNSIAIAISLEILVFNFSGVITTTNDDVSYADCTQATTNVETSQYGTLYSKEENAVLYAYDIPTYIGFESVYIDINYFTMEEDYHVIYEPYEVEIYDAAFSTTTPKTTIVIDPRKPWTKYIPLQAEGIMPNLKFVFHFGENTHFVINDFLFNTGKPFRLKIWRILASFAVCAVAGACAVFWKERRKVSTNS